MRRAFARDVLRTGVSELDEINVAQEAFARAEEHWGYRQIQLIDESGAKILLNSGDAASNTNVFPIRGCCGSLEGAMDSIRHEMERRSSLHRDRLARVVGQYEYRTAKRRRVSPPALPGVVTPRSSNGSEHVSAEDPGTQVLESPSEEIVVDPGRSSVLAVLERPVFTVHALERPCGENPLGQRLPADSHRILEALLRSGTESVDGNREAHFDLGHGLSSYRSNDLSPRMRWPLLQRGQRQKSLGRSSTRQG